MISTHEETVKNLHIISLFFTFLDPDISGRGFEDKRQNVKVNGTILAEKRAAAKSQCALYCVQDNMCVLSSVTMVMLLVTTVCLVQLHRVKKTKMAGRHIQLRTIKGASLFVNEVVRGIISFCQLFFTMIIFQSIQKGNIDLKIDKI